MNDRMRIEDWRFYREAIAAGRNVDTFYIALWAMWDRQCAGKPHAAALKSMVKRWNEVCQVSRTEADLCRAVIAEWAGEDRRRLRHDVRGNGRIRWTCADYPGGGHSIHWKAMRLRRWVHLLGLDDQLAERYKRRAEQADARRAKKAAAQ